MVQRLPQSWANDVGRILRSTGQAFTALEKDSSQVDVVRRYGSKVYYGDASKLDLLRAAGADQARVLVLAIDDVATFVAGKAENIEDILAEREAR